MDRCDQSCVTPTRYVRETQRHVKIIANELLALVRGATVRLDRLWPQLQEQEEVSRQAGFPGDASLCRQIHDCLKQTQEDGQTPMPLAAKAMLAVCRAIDLHAAEVLRQYHRDNASRLATIDRPLLHAAIPPRHRARRMAVAETE